MSSELLNVVQDPRRLEALRRLRALDSPPDETLDGLADLARNLLGVPVALVSLVDEDRQFFKSCLGLEEPWASKRETPLSHSFCQHTVSGREPLVMSDAREHPLVSDNLAIRDLGVVAYLGIPLVTHDGQAVGSLCAIDSEPREWIEADVLLLQTLAEAAIRRLELVARAEELEETRTALAGRERYYRALIEQGMEGVTVLDQGGHILYTSPNSAELLGLSAKERQGKSAFQWVHPDDIPATEEAFGALLAVPGEPCRAAFRYQHLDGRWLHLEGIGKNLLQDPAVEGVVFNFRDVTRERDLEGELRQLQKLETMGELTAGIAHDFNNLLAVVTANAELLEEALRADAGEARQDLDDLRAAARGGAELIRSLMTFSRTSEPLLQPTAMGPVVEQTCRMLGRILPSGIEVRWEVPPDLPPARADARAVEQILFNLATNARDAMPEGGTLTIRLSREDGPPPLVRIEVEDTGRGMDPETLSKAFEPFFTTKEVGQGTGLGLAMIARLVKQHEGTVHAESEVSRGTRIRIRLPEADAPVEGAMVRRNEVSRATGQEWVLVVEDEEALRRTARRVLERAGYQVTAVPDGMAALKELETRGDGISLVLSDQDMPRMSGTRLFQELRQAGNGVPFVLTTGFVARELAEDREPGSGFTLLPKPWSLEGLTRTVREALDGVSPKQVPG